MQFTATKRGAAALALCAASALALQGLISPAAHASAPAAAPTAHKSPVSTIETNVARTFAASLSNASWSAQVRTAALGSKEVSLGALTSKESVPAGLNAAVSGADRKIAAAKGLGTDAGSLLRLRLGTQDMRSALTASASPLVAAATGDDSVATVTAYDSAGHAHALSTRNAPNTPVYVIDIDVNKAMSTGLAQLDKSLAKAGLSSPAVAKPNDGGFWSTKVDSVYLNDDEEPWILGDAEIFSIVSGFGLDGVVRVDTVDMPYLDNDHHTYYPNQLLVNWSNYKYNTADVVMMEDDGDTNYASLAKALADALLTITDQGAYVPLVDAILAAIPSAWYTNDADYVDSWYALTEGSSGTLYGARGNGQMTVEPYWVSAL